MIDYEQDQVNVLASMEAEEAIVGRLLVNPEPLPDVQEITNSREFFYAKTRALFAAIEKLGDVDAEIDVITVATMATSDTGDQSIFAYAVELSANATGTANIKSYAHIISERSLKRKVLDMANGLATYVSTSTSATKDDVLNVAQTAMIELESSQSDAYEETGINECIKSYVGLLDERFRSNGAIKGHSTGFEALDELTGGFSEGLYILAARPSMGKSTLALMFAAQMSTRQKLRGLFFSLEMNKNQLTEKLIACYGKVPLKFMKDPANYPNADAQWPNVEFGARQLKDAPLSIIHCPEININQIKAYVRKASRKNKIDFIVVDHIHIMGAVDEKLGRERQIAQITGGLKSLSGQLGIPVIALAQLNRGVEQRPDKRPMMSDLRDSGSIEQDADVIQFVYRDDYYNEDRTSPNFGLVMLDTVKQRMGENGAVFFENRFDQSRVEPTNRYMCFNPKGAKAGGGKQFLDKL